LTPENSQETTRRAGEIQQVAPGRAISQPKVVLPVLVGAVALGAMVFLVVCLAFSCLTFLRNADYGSALVMWHDVVSKSPQNARAYTNLGVAYSQLGDQQSAILCHRKCIELEPGHVEAWNNLGRAFSKQQDPQSASTCFRRAIALSPDQAEPYHNLGIDVPGAGAYRSAARREQSRKAGRAP